MSSTSASAVTRRQFARIALGGAGAAALAGTVGFGAGEEELALSMSATGRVFDRAGSLIDTRALEPRLVSASLRGNPIRSRLQPSPSGSLVAPAPRVLAFRSGPRGPQTIRRTDRAPDGTLIETVSETLGPGIPARRMVRIPEKELELSDRVEYRRLGELAVFQGRTIEIRLKGVMVADLAILANGEIRVGRLPSLGGLAAGLPFFPVPLAAQSCGNAVFHYIKATLAVVAAIAACGAPVICVLTLMAALVDWAMAIDEIETFCKAE